MKKVFFLDDDETRHRRFMRAAIGYDVTQAWEYESAVKALSENVFDVAYLDHDLSIEAAMGELVADEKTGTHVAEFIAGLPPERRPKFVIVHSFNPVGRMRMRSILQSVGVECIIEPFAF